MTDSNGAARALRERDPRDRRERLKRRLIVGAGLLIAGNIMIFAIISTDTDTDTLRLPPEVQSLTPVEGSVIRPQEQIGIDLIDEPFAIQLYFDDVPIPDDEVRFRSEPLGQYIYTPIAGTSFERWEEGRHQIRAEWTSLSPDSATSGGSITWEVTVG